MSNLIVSMQHNLHEKDVVLTPKEAEAVSPDESSVCGEEDPGVALENLVERSGEE